MTNEELAEKAKNGDDAVLLELWEQVRGWAVKCAYHWHTAFEGRHGVDIDDLISSAFLALLAAVETFNPSAEGSFIGWYTFYLKTEFSKAYGVQTSKRDPLNSADSLDRPVGEDGDATLADRIPCNRDLFAATDDRIYTQQLHEALDDAMSPLTDEQQCILRLRFYDDISYKRQAAICGKSRQYITAAAYSGVDEIRRNTVTMRRLAEFLRPGEHQSFDFSPYRRTGFGAWKSSGSVQEQLCELLV